MPDCILSGCGLNFNPHIWSHDFSHFTHWSTEKLSDLPDFIELFNYKQFRSEGILAHTAITHYHRVGWFKQQTFISHSSGGWQFEIGVPAWLWPWPCKCLLSGLQKTISLTGQGENSLTASYKGANPIHKGSTFVTLLSPQGPTHITQYDEILSHWD